MKTKNIIILSPPGAYGSFVTWMIERCNADRNPCVDLVTDNPLMPNGSSHKFVSVCKSVTLSTITDWMEKPTNSDAGYRIWAGWTVADDQLFTLDFYINEIVKRLEPQDRLVIISRGSEWETAITWLNAAEKLTKEQWFGILKISSIEQLPNALATDFASRFFTKPKDQKVLIITVKDLITAPANQLLQTVSDIGFATTDHGLFEQVLDKNRSAQRSVEILRNIDLAESTNPTVQAVINYIRKQPWIKNL